MTPAHLLATLFFLACIALSVWGVADALIASARREREWRDRLDRAGRGLGRAEDAEGGA